MKRREKREEGKEKKRTEARATWNNNNDIHSYGTMGSDYHGHPSLRSTLREWSFDRTSLEQSKKLTKPKKKETGTQSYMPSLRPSQQEYLSIFSHTYLYSILLVPGWILCNSILHIIEAEKTERVISGASCHSDQLVLASNGHLFSSVSSVSLSSSAPVGPAVVRCERKNPSDAQSRPGSWAHRTVSNMR